MGFLSNISARTYIFIIAATPVLELRGSVPLALTLGLSWQEAFIISFIGNMIPVPIVIVVGRHLINLFKKIDLFNKLAHKLENRFLKKRDVVIKYSTLGLALIVAIPLPGTGAYTGAFLASLLDLRMKYALPSIALGVLIADIIVTGIAYGLFS